MGDASQNPRPARGIPLPDIGLAGVEQVVYGLRVIRFAAELTSRRESADKQFLNKTNHTGT
jgi:hypothetical protein